jgi:acetyl-CoA acyltransferase
LQEGFPVETAATVVERQCGSAQQAVNFGAAMVGLVVHDVVIGAGVEHMGYVPINASDRVQELYGRAWTAKLIERHNIVGQGLGAELIANKYGIGRAAMDAFAVESHRRAADATAAERFRRELVPMNGFVADQGIRPQTTLASLAELKPVFKPDAG